MKTQTFKKLMLIPALAFGLVACNSEDTPEPMPQNDIIDVVVANNDFNTLEAAITQAGLVETLRSTGPFTVFAPTDNAFGDYLGNNNLSAEQLLANPALSDILTYHVVSGSVMASQVSPGPVPTVNTGDFYVSQDVEGNFWINGSARIIETDISASNGVIHVLDYVIYPPSQSIAEIAVGMTEGAEPEFTQLVGALSRAGLVEAVSGNDGDLTVFAPTDAAFQALYTALGVNGYNDIPLETLTAVLTAHVVPARAFSQELRQDMTLDTLNPDARLSVDLAGLTVGGAALNADMLNIHATNGVIHVLDEVIVP